MLDIHFRYVRFLDKASSIWYLPYRQGYKLLHGMDWVTLVVVDDSYDRDNDRWEYTNLPLGKELEEFYNQCFIEVGRFTKPHTGQMIHRDMTGLLHRDNHDGFRFEVEGLGSFMILSHDGTMQLYMLKDCTEVAKVVDTHQAMAEEVLRATTLLHPVAA
jgi:hypothetical protein